MNIKDQRDKSFPTVHPPQIAPGEICICEGVYCMRVVLTNDPTPPDAQDVSFIDMRTGYIKRLAGSAQVIKVASHLHITWD